MSRPHFAGERDLASTRGWEKYMCVYIFDFFTACKIDMVAGIDASGSIWKDQPNQAVGEANWNNVRNFAANLVRDLEIGQSANQVAAVRFEDE